MTFGDHKTLWNLTQGQRVRYAGAIAAMAIGFLFLYSGPLISASAIDDAVSEGASASRLWAAAAAVVGVTVIGCLFAYLRGRWAAVASEAIVRGVRDRLHAHLEALPCRFHDKADTGDLVQRCTSDVETVRVFLSGQVVEIARAVLSLAILVPVFFWLDWKMALVSIAVFPIIIAFAAVFFGRVKALFLKVDEAEAAMTSVLQENLTGIRVVRAFARQDFEIGKFADKNGDHRDLHFRLFRLLGNYWATSDLLCNLQQGLVLFAGAVWLGQGALSVGTLFAFITLVAIIIWPVRQLGRVLQETGKAIVALKRLREILEEQPETRGGVQVDGPLEGALDVENLTFSFNGEEAALRDVSFCVRAGESLALLGPPGSGKSTLVQVLLRLYDYTEGSIRLDGHELRDLSREFVRGQIGVVMQEPFLYSKTIGANLQLGRTSATHEEIVESATDAQIHGAILDFEKGYDTLVGERGVTLSGGQRQRVALARALLKDPAILVLDDALSAVDTETETQILDALKRRRGKHTTIIVAHRLSSVVHADTILVFDKGAVVQKGTHSELAREDGPYKRLCEIQHAEGALP